jgi:hypothetical protein
MALFEPVTLIGVGAADGLPVGGATTIWPNDAFPTMKVVVTVPPAGTAVTSPNGLMAACARRGESDPTTKVLSAAARSKP